jgi:hypothetical protein
MGDTGKDNDKQRQYFVARLRLCSGLRQSGGPLRGGF